ncbi:MAG: CHRD domain-containing protein [Gemmatimonadota bacterium]
MRRIARALALAAMCSIAPASASAQITLFANLTTGAEPSLIGPTMANGAPRPVPFGTATLTINAAQTQMMMVATIFNIDVGGAQTADPNDNLTAAHIHASSTTIIPTAGVVWGLFGTPDNDVAPKQLVITPNASGLGATFTSTWDMSEGNNTTLSAQLANILAGRSYLNFHTVQNPGGEIRGTLVVVPEPATVLLTAAGLALLAIARKRRTR